MLHIAGTHHWRTWHEVHGGANQVVIVTHSANRHIWHIGIDNRIAIALRIGRKRSVQRKEWSENDEFCERKKFTYHKQMNLFLYKGFFRLGTVWLPKLLRLQRYVDFVFFSFWYVTRIFVFDNYSPNHSILFHQNFLSIHDVDTFHRSRMGDSIERNVVFWQFVGGFHLNIVHS